MPRLLSSLARRLDFWARYLEDPWVRRARALGVNAETYARLRGPWLAQAGIASVIDIGANTGQFAGLILDALPQARVVAFEPLPDCYATLAGRMAGRPNFRAYNVALGSTSGTRTFYRNPFSLSSSFRSMTDLHQKSFPETGGANTPEPVEVRTLDSYAAELDLPARLLVKVDVQGFEDEVLRGGQAVMSRAHLVLIETSFQPLYDPQPSFHDLYACLAGWGFEFRGSLDQTYSPVDGRPLQADALFAKPAP